MFCFRAPRKIDLFSVMSKEDIKISLPMSLSPHRQRVDIDAKDISLHWGQDKEIRLSDVLEFVLKQIETNIPWKGEVPGCGCVACEVIRKSKP